MKSTCLPTSLLLLLFLEMSCVSPLESNKPNFVLIMVDDMGIGDLGCYGNKTLRTPNIDQLAREGAKLTHHIAAANLCTPSRAAFLTGRYPIRSDAAAILHCCSIITIPRWLIWSLLSLSLVVTALLGGFMMIIPYMNCVLMRDHRVVEQQFTSENLTETMTKEAVDFIESNSGKPFLLFLSFIQVHTAMFASAVFRGTSQHGIYGDAIHEVDWSVGQMVSALERLKLRENTLVYLTSDHGAHLEETQHGSNGIYKAGKATNWEGGIRVPGILSWPGKIPSGVQIDEPTSNMDLFPTVVHLSGASVPEDRVIDGHDLMDLLQKRVERSNHEFLFHYCKAYLNAVRWHPQNSISVCKGFYFTQNFDPENATTCVHTQVCACMPGYVTHHNPPLLFDLSKDPSETTPLTPDTEPAFESIVSVMAEAVERHRRSVKPVENQLSVGNLIWKPWLQPCCSTLGQLCQCQH